MFKSSLFFTLMAYKKKNFWSIHFYKEIHWKCLGVSENFSFTEVSHEYVKVINRMFVSEKIPYPANTFNCPSQI